MSDDETFEKVDAGASQTVPKKIGDLKKGDYAMLKGKPCKVMEISVSKTGKHGHAKAAIVGIDIFTNNKIEDGGPTSHNIDSPNVDRKEYTLIDIASDDFCSLMEEDGELKEDLKLFPQGEDETHDNLRKAFDDGKECLVSVIKAVGQERIVSFREKNQ